MLLVTCIGSFSQKLNKVNGICENSWPAHGLFLFCTLALSEFWCGHKRSDLIAHEQPLYQLSEGQQAQECGFCLSQAEFSSLQ